jgi:hypothetical protein
MRALVLACVLVVSACGLSSEDEPQIIEESTQQPPPATPSFDTEPSPAGSSRTPPTTTPTTGSAGVRSPG